MPASSATSLAWCVIVAVALSASTCLASTFLPVSPLQLLEEAAAQLPRPTAQEHAAARKKGSQGFGAPSVFSTTVWNSSFSLAEAASFVSVVSSNSSFFVTGGCLDLNCTTRSNKTHQYDLTTGEIVVMPELTVGGVAGRTVAVPVDDKLYIVRACSIISKAELSGLTDDTIANFSKVEVLSPADGTVSFVNLNVSLDDARANATCLQFNSPSTNPVIFIIGGYLLREQRLTSRISMIVLDAFAPQFVANVGNLPRPTMNLGGYSTTSSLFLVGGFVDTSGTPSLHHYTILTSADITNLPLCVFESATLPTGSSVPSLQRRWNDMQMVGFASRQLILTDESVLSLWELGIAEFYPNAIEPTYFEPGVDTWTARHGSTLVIVPYWQPNATDVQAVRTVLFRVGGFAVVNRSLPVTTTAAPTSEGPSTTAGPTTIAPETTTNAPTTEVTSTTAAPTTTTEAPTTTTTIAPPPATTTGPNATLQVRAFTTTTGRAAPASTAGAAAAADAASGGWIVGDDGIRYEETLMLVPNITFAFTSITLPSPDVASTLINSSTGFLEFTLTSSDTYDDGTNQLCFDTPAASLCQLETAKDASCFNKIKAFGPIVQRDVDLPLVSVSAGSPFWVCFTFGNHQQQPSGHAKCPANFAPDGARLQYSVLNFFHPFMIESIPPPTPPPTPAPEGDAPFLSNKVTIVLAVVAVALLVGLIATIVIFRRRAKTLGHGHSERYTELEEIGRGAFGRVIRVKRNSDGAIFAKKHIDCPHAEVLQEALKEFELLRTLQAHPNIIRVVDMFLNYEILSAPAHAPTSTLEANAGVKDGSPLLGRAASRLSNNEANFVPAAPTRHLCIVMDYHPKKDLKLWALDYPGRIPEPVLCHVAVQSCSVLSFIHQKNVIHRDLKPENILIVSQQHDDLGVAIDVPMPGSARGGRNDPRASNGGGGWPRLMQQVVVTDFGLAHLVAEGRSVGFVGTAVYSAPECVALLLGRGANAALTPQRPDALGAVNATPRALGGDTRSRGPGTAVKSGRHARTGSLGYAGVSSQCDIWSLGCVLYAVATKRLERQTVRKMFEDVHRPEFATVITDELLREGYSRPFAGFILRLLRAAPEERPSAKDALKYFRKSNRDGSYSVSDTQKYTPQEKAEMEKRKRDAASTAAAGPHHHHTSGGGGTPAGGSSRHLGPSRPASKASARGTNNSGPLRPSASTTPKTSAVAPVGSPRPAAAATAAPSPVTRHLDPNGPGGDGHSSELGTVNNNATPRTAQPTPREEEDRGAHE